MVDEGWDYRTSVACGKPGRPDHPAGVSNFEHVPDGGVIGHDGAILVKVRNGHGFNAVSLEGERWNFEPTAVVLYDHNDETPERIAELAQGDPS